MLRCGYAPDKVYRIARETFEGKYDDPTIRRWLKNFYRRFFTQQFKRSCLPDGPKVGSVALSPRGDLRMPYQFWRTRGGINMTKAEILKKEILRQYRSVRQFAMEMNIPYSTLVTALERGIEGMAYGTVIKMCDKLSLNPVDFSSLERDASLGAQLLENRVMQNYVKLNQTGRDKILELMDDFVQIDKYKAKSKKAK